MFYKSVITFVVSLTLAMGSLPLAAQTETKEALPESVPALLVKANQAYAAEDYLTFRKALESLHKLRPNNSDYMYQLVIAHALLDEKSQAYDLMLRMQKQGLAYDFMATDNSMNIRGTQVFDYVNDLMKVAAEPTGESEPLFVLPQIVKMPEAISWDASRQKFLVGTIADGQIFAVGKDGQVDELLKADDKNRLWAIFDILVDQPRNRLWVSSASTPGFANYDPVDKGRSALIEFNLETLELIKRYPVPVDANAHILGSMVLSPDGDIYIADRALPLVYSKPAGEQKLKPLLAFRDLISQRGLAMQPDGRILYVADREMGIMVVDMQGRQARLLAVPETLNLAGIDGLYLKDNALYVIQNGIQPQRVMRLNLDASGTKIDAVSPVAVAQPEFDLPSFGTIEGEYLYYFANSQPLGKAGSQKPVTVLRSPLNVAGGTLVQPDIQQFLKQQAEMNKQREQEDKKD
jgi:sugar lactone lactonase YvrE